MDFGYRIADRKIDTAAKNPRADPTVIGAEMIGRMALRVATEGLR